MSAEEPQWSLGDEGREGGGRWVSCLGEERGIEEEMWVCPEFQRGPVPGFIHDLFGTALRSRCLSPISPLIFWPASPNACSVSTWDVLPIPQTEHVHNGTGYHVPNLLLSGSSLVLLMGPPFSQSSRKILQSHLPIFPFPLFPSSGQGLSCQVNSTSGTSSHCSTLPSPP